MNNKIKTIELFAGIGAWKKTFTNLGIENDTIPIEIDKDTLKGYDFIHNKIIKNYLTFDIKNNLIFKNNIDVLLMSPPCQGFSHANNKKIVNDKRNNLINYTISIIEQTKPRYIILENVPNFKNATEYLEFLKKVKEFNYLIKEKILNPINYNWPQNRPRLFTILFKNDNDYKNYNWPKKEKLIKNISNVINSLDKNNNWMRLPTNSIERKNKNGFVWGKYIDNRAYKKTGYCGAITTFNTPLITDMLNTSIRKLHTWEIALLMGFTLEDHNNLINSNSNLTKSKIIKMYGNSIVIPLLEKILKNLDFKKENLKNNE